MFLTNLDHHLNASLADVYCKDKMGYYLEVNQRFLEISELSSLSDVMGKTDLDLIWRDDAVNMMRNDLEVISSGKSKIVIEQAKVAGNKLDFFLNFKSPLLSNDNKILGVFGISYSINTNNQLLTCLHELSQYCDDAQLRKKLKEQTILLKATQLGLTQQQANCLLQLIKGKSIKQIANTISLSPRTVEHYLETVKIKLNCYSRSELIEFFIDFLL